MSEAPQDGRYKVFISSTFRDNRERREQVLSAILRAEMTPIGMERFEAGQEPPLEFSLQKVREADLVLVIVAHRYGTIPEGHEKSIVEQEYEAAGERLVFVVSDDVLIDRERDLDPGPDRWLKQQKLDEFKVRLRNRCRLCGRPRGFLRKFALCRLCFRRLALEGEVAGVIKSSW